MACYVQEDNDEFHDALLNNHNDNVNYVIDFTSVLQSVRNSIKQSFEELHGSLYDREQELYSELDNKGTQIVKSLSEYKKEIQKLEHTLEELNYRLKDNLLIQTLSEAKRPVIERLAALTDQCNNLLQLSFTYKSSYTALITDISLYGHINSPAIQLLNTHTQPTLTQQEKENMFKNRSKPKWVKDIPNSNGILVTKTLVPTRQLSLEQFTQRLAIADSSQECIHIFTCQGEYLNKLLIKFGKPIGVAFYGHHLFVTSLNTIAKFDSNSLDLMMSRSVESVGVIDIGLNGDIYTNHQVTYTILRYSNENLNKISQVNLKTRDIESNRSISDFKVIDTSLYILFRHSNSFLSEFSLFSRKEYPLQIYSLKGDHLKSLVSGEVLRAPAFFCLDQYSNILVTSIGMVRDEIIAVCSQSGHKLASIGQFWLYGIFQPTSSVCNPTGIAVNSSDGTILVASTFTSYPVLQAY